MAHNGDDESKLIEDLLRGHHRDEFIQLFDQALSKWLDQKFSQFGKWTAGGIAAAFLALLAYSYVHVGGWLK